MTRLSFCILISLSSVCGCGGDDDDDGDGRSLSPGSNGGNEDDSGASGVATLGNRDGGMKDGGGNTDRDGSTDESDASTPSDAGADGGESCIAKNEECNGLDDDCDDHIDEDFDIGRACDGPDQDSCKQGSRVCKDGEAVCEEGAVVIDDEICDGIDNDCDDDVDEGFDVDAACDGIDPDQCKDGLTVCNDQGTGVQCDDPSDDATLELCDGLDNDCNEATADGRDDARIGRACDGEDTDLCEEGTYSCDQGLHCSDETSSTDDECNGVDDDCDPSSEDGSEDRTAGMACDGSDSDLCQDGKYVCGNDQQMLCDDDDTSTVDTCDGTDDDCDPDSEDGSGEPILGMACDGLDEDQCVEGEWFCEDGSLGCTDDTSASVDACTGQDDCIPDCPQVYEHLGSISGDLAGPALQATGSVASYRVFSITESNALSSDLSVTITLDSPTGNDFDLYIYENQCAFDDGVYAYSDASAGTPDTVTITLPDTAADDGATFTVEIDHYNGTVCAEWSLTITHNPIIVDPT